MMNNNNYFALSCNLAENSSMIGIVITANFWNVYFIFHQNKKLIYISRQELCCMLLYLRFLRHVCIIICLQQLVNYDSSQLYHGFLVGQFPQQASPLDTILTWDAGTSERSYSIMIQEASRTI